MGLLAAVAIAEAILAAAVAGLVIGRAAWTGRQERAGVVRLRRARAEVAGVLDGTAGHPAVPPAVAQLPAGERIRLFCDLARTLDGARRRELAELADRAGLSAAADAWCRRRRWWWRLRGARLLTALGSGGSGMLDLFDDPRAEVRAQAAEWAAGHPSPESVRRLLELLRDEQTLCRFTVKDSLLRIGPDASAPVAQYLSDQQGARVHEALEVATGLADPSFLDPALRHAAGGDPAARAGAAALLGAIGGVRATERLLALLDDPDAGVRAASAHALGRLSHWPAAAALYERLGDPAWAVRRAAALSLRRLGPAGLLMLRRGTDHPDAFGRDMAQQVFDLPDTGAPAR